MSVGVNQRVRQIVSFLLILVLISVTLSCIRVVRYAEEEMINKTMTEKTLSWLREKRR